MARARASENNVENGLRAFFISISAPPQLCVSHQSRDNPRAHADIALARFYMRCARARPLNCNRGE